MFTRDAQEAFIEAIQRGVLTEQTAGDYMYMYSTEDGDWFKNVMTREYVKAQRVCKHGLQRITCPDLP